MPAVAKVWLRPESVAGPPSAALSSFWATWTFPASKMRRTLSKLALSISKTTVSPAATVTA